MQFRNGCGYAYPPLPLGEGRGEGASPSACGFAPFLLAEQQRADRQQAIKPSPRLVDRLADEVGGKLPGQPLRRSFLPRISPLGERHRPAVEPAVDHVRHALHPPAGRIGRIVRDRVDIRLVDAEVVGKAGVLLFRLLPDLDAGHARLGQQLFVGCDGLGLCRFFHRPRWAAACPNSAPATGPNRRCSPENCRTARRGCARAASGSGRCWPTCGRGTASCG